MKYIITYDVGTTAIKTSVFDESLNMVASRADEYKLDTATLGIVEVDSSLYWNIIAESTKKTARELGIGFDNIEAVAITSQGETLIPVDSAQRPLYNAIVWLDRRADEQSQKINSLFEKETIYKTTGLPEINGMMPISKVLWFKENLPEIYEKTDKFLLLEDFLIMKMTSRIVTEKSLMSSTGYYDIVNDRLWGELLSKLSIDTANFPEILNCGALVGELTESASAQLGFKKGVKVYTSAMDQAASTIGAGNVLSGSGVITETSGTAMVIGAITDSFDYKKLSGVTVYRHALDGCYLILPYCETAGILLKWFKDEFCADIAAKSGVQDRAAYRLMDKLSEDVLPCADGLICFPYFSGMITPEINGGAKGVFFGVGLNSKRRHFVRAIQEGIAYMLKEQLDFLTDIGVGVNTVYSLGGCTKSKVLCQIKADVLNCPIKTLACSETTSLGAAMLAAGAMGWISVEEAAKKVSVCGEYRPVEKNVGLYADGYKNYKKLYQSLKDFF